MKCDISITAAALTSLCILFGCTAEDSNRGITKPFRANVAAAHSAFSKWSAPENLGSVINTAHNEQGPTISNDELTLYFGSDRPGGLGGFDIWVSRRDCSGCPWQAPVNLGAPVNSPAFETGPSISIDGHLLFFRSDRPGGKGRGDVYVSSRSNANDDSAWETPVGLGDGVNTAAEEAGAEYLASAEDGTVNVYFNRAVPPAGADLYRVAVTRDGETLGNAEPVAELNHPVATDQGPTLRGDGREIIFFSARPGGSGGVDFWGSTRRSVHDAWNPPVNLGPVINSPANEQQPNLADQGRTLLFASNRTGGFGGTDIWVSKRTRGN